MLEKEFVGIDIGGTNIRLISSPSLENPQLNSRKALPTSNKFQANIEHIEDYIDRKQQVRGIGISITGDVDTANRKVTRSVYAPAFQGEPLGELLQKRYECEVRMDNDANSAAYGEALYGHHRHVDFVYIIWGTGIGGASVTYNKNKPSVSSLDWDKYFRDWSESCGGSALQKKFGILTEKIGEKDWSEVMGQFQHELLTFTSKFNPKKIIFGGGISIRQANRLMQLSKELHDENYSLKIPNIEAGNLGENAGLYGALGLLKNK